MTAGAAAALTLMPALLGAFEARLPIREQRRRPSSDGPRQVPSAPLGVRWSRLVAWHPVVLSLAVLEVVAAVSLPTLSVRLGSSDASNDPAATTTRPTTCSPRASGPASTDPC